MIFGGNNVMLRKITTALVCILCVYSIGISIFCFGIRGSGDPDSSGTGDDISTELDGIREDLQSITGNQSYTIELIKSQGLLIDRLIESTESIGSGIVRSTELAVASQTILEQLRTDELEDFELLTENRSLLEDGQRIVGNLRGESGEN